MNSRFRLYGKEFIKWAKIEKARNAARVSARGKTVDAWFEFWIANLIADLAPNTRRNYRERYERNIQPVIGSMRLCDVKPMHCKIVLNRMEATYAGSTIRKTYIAMGAMFRAAVTNDMLTKHRSISICTGSALPRICGTSAGRTIWTGGCLRRGVERKRSGGPGGSHDRFHREAGREYPAHHHRPGVASAHSFPSGTRRAFPMEVREK